MRFISYDVYTVAGKGNHAVHITFIPMKHANPQGKNLYYRIKQKTDNGNYVYSRAITTDNSCKVVEDANLAQSNLSVSPNPVAGNMNNAELILFQLGREKEKELLKSKSVTWIATTR
jgi:hypothetical protein